MKVLNAVALVTGGASGFGREFCKSLLSQGAKVIIADIDAKAGKELEQECSSQYGKRKSVFMQCDVANSQQLQELFKNGSKHFGHLDIVCNNAGIFSTDPKQARLMVDLNLGSVIEGTFLGLDVISQNSAKSGVIINVASAAGFQLMPHAPVYTATKFGVVAFTRSFKHMKTGGIRVNCLCPGFVETPLIAKAVKERPDLATALLSGGFASLADVVTAFNNLIADDSMNAKCIAVLPGNKIFPLSFPPVQSAL